MNETMVWFVQTPPTPPMLKDTCLALPKGVKAPKPENAPIFFALADLDKSLALPGNLPEWIQKLIKESRDWEKLTCKADKAGQPAPSVAVGAVADDLAEDDVPF